MSLKHRLRNHNGHTTPPKTMPLSKDSPRGRDYIASVGSTS